MTSLENTNPSNPPAKVHRIGIRDMHSLMKAALLAGAPTGAIWLIYEGTRYGTSFEGGMIIFIFAIVMMIVGLPMIFLIFAHFVKGIGIVIGNALSQRAIPQPTHVLYSKHGIRLLGSTLTSTFAIEGRKYSCDDVSHIEYVVPDVRIRLRRGANAMEIIAVGDQRACEEYMRGFCDLAGLEF